MTQIPATVITALSKDATITDKGAGKLEISGKAKHPRPGPGPGGRPAAGNVPGGSKTDVDKVKESLSQIPDSQTLTFDVTLKDGAVPTSPSTSRSSSRPPTPAAATCRWT